MKHIMIWFLVITLLTLSGCMSSPASSGDGYRAPFPSGHAGHRH